MLPTNVGMAGGKKQWAHPGHALFVAQRIAEIKKVPLDTVLEACLSNTLRLYGMKIV